MSNIYTIPSNSIVDVFNDVDKFLIKVDKFKEYQPDYQYEISIIESEIKGYKWELRLKVWNDESENNKVFDKVENPFGVL